VKKDILGLIRVNIDSTANITGSNPSIVKSMLPDLAHQQALPKKSLHTSIILKSKKEKRGDILWQ